MSYPYPIFVIGVARAGTTLVARIIAASSKTATALIDSQESLFKALRTKIGNSIGIDTNIEDALWDAYFSEDRLSLVDNIQQADFSSVDISNYQPHFANEIAESSKQFSPMIVNKERFSKVRTVYDSINGIIEDYATSDKPMVVFKDNYIIEFARPLKLIFPKAKFIFPYRDPRAVVASRISASKKHGVSDSVHLISRLRAWRSHLAWAYAFLEEFPEDGMMVPYEALTNNPKEWVQRISNFLNIPFEKSMLGTIGFFAGDSTSPWTSNSSFDTTAPGIFTDSVEKWKSILSADFIKATEYLCFHEMGLLGYTPESITELPIPTPEVQEFLANDRHVDTTVWRSDTQSFEEEIACEQARHEFILNKNSASSEDIRLSLLTRAMAGKLFS